DDAAVTVSQAQHRVGHARQPPQGWHLAHAGEVGQAQGPAPSGQSDHQETLGGHGGLQRTWKRPVRARRRSEVLARAAADSLKARADRACASEAVEVCSAPLALSPATLEISSSDLATRSAAPRCRAARSEISRACAVVVPSESSMWSKEDAVRSTTVRTPEAASTVRRMPPAAARAPSRISLDKAETRSASARTSSERRCTSSATTANPRPCSPARAASMAALMASRCVCWETEEMAVI